ncbi:hypothetical protein F4778DRAFT_777335 [Xylariomycetidae sp. FL2044]|nr:hypothetical protein F4778DRAFT_777335 [Xylariomycetidae sp. FL2044]
MDLTHSTLSLVLCASNPPEQIVSPGARKTWRSVRVMPRSSRNFPQWKESDYSISWSDQSFLFLALAASYKDGSANEAAQVVTLGSLCVPVLLLLLTPEALGRLDEDTLMASVEC